MTSEAPYPPAEQPADGDRTNQVPPPPASGRYAASASVPGPPTGPQHSGPQNSGPQHPGTGQVYGTNPWGQAPQARDQGYGPPPDNTERIASAATVPPPLPNPYSPPPSYGGPPQQTGAFPAGTYGGPPPASRGDQGGWDQGGGYAGQGGGGGYGSPMGQGPTNNPQMGQNYPAPPPNYPPSGRPEQPRNEPTGGWPYLEPGGPGNPPAKKPRNKTLLIIGVIAVVLVLGGVAAITYLLTNRPDPFVVGACVKQDGTRAVKTECSEAGVYEIVSLADSEEQCPDRNQPSVVLENKVACLKPRSP